MRWRDERGFSMLVVLLVAVILAAVGSSVVYVATSDAGTAGARNMRAQALAAAEAGLAHFNQVAHPSMMTDTWYLGGGGDTDADFLWLPDVPGRNGGTLQARYRVRGVGPGPLPKTGLAVIEGQVLSGGRIVGQAELGVLVQTQGGVNEAGLFQEDYSETGASADDGSNDSVELEGGEFDV